MRRPEGYFLIIPYDGGPVIERDSVQCRHCQRIVEVKPGTLAQVYLIPDEHSPTGHREEAGAYCGSCSGPICLGCAELERVGRLKCANGSRYWERQMEQRESRARLLRAVTG